MFGRKPKVPPLGTRTTLCNWVRDGENEDAPLIDMVRYGDLLSAVPSRVRKNLEAARLAQEGKVPMLKWGLGYEELLSSVIVDGTPITSSSTEAFLFPALLIPANYLQPGGIPGRTIRLVGRGRHTTLTTGLTLTFKIGAALTNVIPSTTWCVSGALVMDANVQTATMWSVDADIVVRSVGSAGTVWAQGEANVGAHFKDTAAKQALQFMGSAGAATPSTAAVDMTVPQYFSLTGKWSNTTAYSITGHQFLVEALN